MNKAFNIIRALFTDGLGDRLFSPVDRFSLDWNKWNRRIFILLLPVLAVHLGIYLYSVVKVFPFPYSFKGPFGDETMIRAWLLSRGLNFYVTPGKEYSGLGPYNPGMILLTAPLVRLFGLHMWVGRVVSVSGLVLVWLLIYRAAKKLTGQTLYGLVAVGLLMAAYGAMGSHFDDIHPDSWCIAMGLMSLAAVEHALQKPAWIFYSALFVFLSFFFKQPGISFAAGPAVYLYLSRPRYAAWFLLLLAVLMAANYILGQVLTGGTYWEYTVMMIMNQKIVWSKIPICLFSQICTFSFLVIFLVFMLLNRPASFPLSSPYALALPFVYLGFGTASFSLYGGTWTNFFAAAVLIAILTACGLQYVRTTLALAAPRFAVLLLTLVLAQGLNLFASPPLFVFKDHYRAARQVEDYVRTAPGEVLVFYRIAFAYLNGRQVYNNWLSVFELGDLGSRQLESKLRSRYFVRIISPRKAIVLGMHGALLDALEQNYEEETVINWPVWSQTTPLVILKRRGEAAPPGVSPPGPAGQNPAPALLPE